MKEAAAAYLEVQVQLLFAAREAHDADLTVTELYRVLTFSWGSGQ